MAQYGQAAYWEDRYAKDPEPFEWYQRYDALRDLLRAVVPASASVLVAGCGNSRLTAEMWKDGFAPIANVDISRTVIDQMSARHKDMRGVTWAVGNVMQLAFADGAVDAVVDKGTLDSLLCGDNSTANGGRYLSEVCRVLKPSGVFFCVSYGNPDNRLQYFENDDARTSPRRQLPPARQRPHRRRRLGSAGAAAPARLRPLSRARSAAPARQRPPPGSARPPAAMPALASPLPPNRPTPLPSPPLAVRLEGDRQDATEADHLRGRRGGPGGPDAKPLCLHFAEERRRRRRAAVECRAAGGRASGWRRMAAAQAAGGRRRRRNSATNG